MSAKVSEGWIRVNRCYNLKEANYYYLLHSIFQLIIFETDEKVKNEYG